MNRSGLIALSDAVRAYLPTIGVTTTVTPVGWRYRTFNVNQGPGGANRVSFIPGKIDPTSPAPPKVVDGGTFYQPKFGNAGKPLGANANPRRLLSWERIVSLSVWAVDTTDTSNDELQLAALENLVEATFQAMHNGIDPVSGLNVGLADIEMQDSLIVAPPVEQSFGREFILYFLHKGPMYDAPIPTVVVTPTIERNPAS